MRLYAIWKYAGFPHFLCGEVKEILPSGDVRVKGYDGMIFQPIKIVPEDAGKKIVEVLGDLRIPHRRAKERFDAEWLAKANTAIGGAP